MSLAIASPGKTEPKSETTHGFGSGAFVFRDTWYALAHAARLGRRPLARRIGGQGVVLWRDGTGQIVALEDRCCHRRAPLSEGWVHNGVIQCGYHGWCYDGSGRCVRVPSMPAGKEVPEAFRVPAYPVAERYGFIWVWWGDPARADASLIPDVPFLEPHRRPPVQLENVFETANELALENLMDMTHTDFVHGGVFGDPGAGEEDVSVESTEETVTMTRVTGGRKTPALLKPFFGFPREIRNFQTMRIQIRNGIAFGIAWIDPPGLGTAILLSNVPETPDRTRQVGSAVVLARPRCQGGKGGRIRWFEHLVASWVTRLVSHQDKRILRRQAPAYRSDESRLDRSVPADVAGLRLRKCHERLVERQLAGDFSYANGWQGTDAAQAMRCDRVPGD